MTSTALVLRGARYYWRTHLGVVLGAALSAMVLTGSLLVGDSVKATLRRQAELRIGQANTAVFSSDRFFRQELRPIEFRSAEAIMLRGSVARADGAARVNSAQVIGVGFLFWGFSQAGDNYMAYEFPEETEARGGLPAGSPSEGAISVNTRLARQLNVALGDTLIVRVEKPGSFSKDAPLSGEENESVAIRAKVERIQGDRQFGRFALTPSQTPPFTVFLNLATLQAKLGLEHKANLLLARGPYADPKEAASHTSFARKPNESWADAVAARIKLLLRDVDRGIGSQALLVDDSYTLRGLPAGGLELRTSRVFLDPPVEAAAADAGQAHGAALTYFVNELRSGEKATPYSMVTGAEPQIASFLPGKLADNEIAIAQWLADDLGISLGGSVTLKFYVMGERRQLVEQAREFKVAAILPMDAPGLDSSWMPEFPGLADKKNCRDWKPGFAFDATRMRDKDQQYWEQYHGTPKAFVNLKVAQHMWGNRWGNTTALRWPAATDRSKIEQALRDKVTPEMLGFQVIPLREQALAATKAPVDFGELFVSFSFFLIAAAAVLTGLLFAFSLEQRNAEAGLLLALGLRPKQVRRLFLAEGAMLAFAGGILGVIGAVVYTKLVLRALATVWSGAVGAVQFQFAADPVTLPAGLAASVLIALLAMWLASRRQLRHSARELLAGESGTDLQSVSANPGALQETHTGRDGLKIRPTFSRTAVPTGVAAVSLLLAVAIPFLAGGAEAFFGAGSLLLIAGLALAWRWLRGLARAGGGLASIAQLGVRNAARRRGRSLATIAVLASGVFMVVAVDSFRHQPLQEGDTSNPGTGGFALAGESSTPIYEDLNSPKGREAYGLSEETMRDVHVVPMRVKDGDDASCLNLNRALQPRLLGVKPSELTERHAFLFSAKAAGWPLLDVNVAAEEIPGIVDANTLEWAMQKKIGDTIEYRDDGGQPFRVRLVATLTGSLLQGSVLIAESEFVKRFPNSGGYRSFFIACPPEKTRAVREHLSRQLADRGLELVSSAQRLGEFEAVENTYLSIFQALGGLGLLLGSAGLAIVVARNVLERRREFGLLEAVGFRTRQLRQLVFAEHQRLIAAALIIGTASALLAVWPNLAGKGGGFPVREVAFLLVALALGCLFWTWLATRLALRGSGVAALRSE